MRPSSSLLISPLVALLWRSQVHPRLTEVKNQAEGGEGMT